MIGILETSNSQAALQLHLRLHLRSACAHGQPRCALQAPSCMHMPTLEYDVSRLLLHVSMYKPKSHTC